MLLLKRSILNKKENKKMKKVFLGLFVLMMSIPAFATAPLAKMNYSYGNIDIVFTNFADATNSFEKYKCYIDLGWSQPYVINAVAVQADGKTQYKCQDYGYLQSGVVYDVYFTFKAWPSDYIYQSAQFKLKAQ